ncbi:MAG: hypothetical protein WD696_06100 [Bryobacteraceae bacterium]
MRITRRSLLPLAAAAVGCGRTRARGYPGFAYVANQEGRSVVAVDLTEFAVARQIALGAKPAAITANNARGTLYVLLPEAGVVQEIDGRSFTLRRRARLPAPGAYSMRLSADGETLWILARDVPALLRLPTGSFQPSMHVRLPKQTEDFDISADGQRAAVSLSGGGVAICTLGSGRIARTIHVPSARIVRFRFDGRQIIAGGASDRALSILDPEKGRIVVRLPLPIDPQHFCFNADGGQLFVTGRGMDAVVVVHPYQTEVSATVLAGGGPAAMAASRSPEYLFVANPESGDVTVLDLLSRRVIAVVAVGAEPRHLSLTPDQQYCLVLNERSGNLAVIYLGSVSARRHKSAPLFTMIPVGSKPVGAAILSA